ncbi:MAG: hypothetical protein RL522_2878 [Pseudomonadota bacterium]|jgi:uncharacterized membrane protein YbhN (UPF0104 family)
MRPRHRSRAWLLRALAVAFFAALAYFGWRYARHVAWYEVWRALAATPTSTLLAAAALSAASHAMYSSFDLLGRAYTGHHLGTGAVMRITFISYAFNLNLGSLVGGVALRLRLYARQGLSYLTITRILTLSIVTNWVGYLALAGLVLTLAPPEPPPGWALSGASLHLLGPLMLATAFAYGAACVSARPRRVRIRRHVFRLPSPALLRGQLALSCANWALMGALLYVLLQGQVPYVTVLAVLLVASIAGVITHVPANLGVLEAVFVALLSQRVPEPQLLAALLAFRAIYYLVPLGVATLLYLAQETRAATSASRPAPTS